MYNGWPSLTIINPHFTASSTILNHTQPPVGPPKNVDLSKQIMGLLIYLAHTWNQQAEHWHFKSNISDFKTKEIGRHPPVFFLDWQWQIPFQWKLIYDNININGNNVPLTFAQVSSNISTWISSTNLLSITGWWFQPLWKIWKSVGIIIPDRWKIKFMFETTNQIANGCLNMFDV